MVFKGFHIAIHAKFKNENMFTLFNVLVGVNITLKVFVIKKHVACRNKMAYYLCFETYIKNMIAK